MTYNTLTGYTNQMGNKRNDSRKFCLKLEKSLCRRNYAWSICCYRFIESVATEHYNQFHWFWKSFRKMSLLRRPDLNLNIWIHYNNHADFVICFILILLSWNFRCGILWIAMYPSVCIMLSIWHWLVVSMHTVTKWKLHNVATYTLVCAVQCACYTYFVYQCMFVRLIHRMDFSCNHDDKRCSM